MCGILAYHGDHVAEAAVELLRPFGRMRHRGPDHSLWETVGPKALFGFHRLAIRGLGPEGNQPLWSSDGRAAVVCNGEVYNDAALRAEIGPYPWRSRSDCEVILPLVRMYGLRGACERLDAEFAFAYFDGPSGKVFAARDPIGIRPLFYGHPRRGGGIVFASEAKALHDFCGQVRVFPPGHYYDGETFIQYRDPSAVARVITDDETTIAETLEHHLVEGVRKRLASDAKIGFLLSGGLDSSLVCAIASRLQAEPIETFAIGMTKDAIDVKYARLAARHIGARHHDVYVTEQQALDAIRDVIYHLETWDITTIRASVGMYLVCKYIREHTDIKVLLTGEVSDELFGYKYTDYAPSAAAFQDEAAKRVRELHCYDVLRADRCISAHAMEARVPFGDIDFASYVMALEPSGKLNRNGMGKRLLRQAFAGKGYLPDELLYREKAAFSDAVGHSMVDAIKAFSELRYTEVELAVAQAEYRYAAPFTKESLLYREIFEGFYPGRAELVPAYWMPNRDWENCAVSDPSARALPNYGASGE
ncbi:asparagine synthase B [Sorangium sp. So ce321]|uniref:asparagine synthase B n=1 Tax=Sorangium sp. So ce321 TaxID=3133300 RepID=UPI003F644894